MGEWADQWKEEGARTSGARCPVIEMQSEGGAQHLHGALQAERWNNVHGVPGPSLDSQYVQIAGELTPTVIHGPPVPCYTCAQFSAITATMGARATGFALLIQIPCRKPEICADCPGCA
jgi:hypothetical protein